MENNLELNKGNFNGCSEENPQGNHRLPLTREKKRLIFYIIMMIWPVTQLAIFYFYANISALSLAFQKYSLGVGEKYQIDWVFLDNFKRIIDLFKGQYYLDMIWNSILLHLFKLVAGTALALIFSYYIYKKFALSEFYRVMLFLPSIISGVVLIMLYRYVVTDVYMELFNAKEGLMSTHTMAVVVFYNVWVSFGSNVLLYCGAMSGINDSICESAQLDGVNIVGEFIYITLPMIFPTIVTFIVVGIAGIFSDNMHLYTFYMEGAPFQTVGYFIYVQSLKSGLIPLTSVGDNIWLSYSEISALGLMITAVICPVSLITRNLLEKYGPSDH